LQNFFLIKFCVQHDNADPYIVRVMAETIENLAFKVLNVPH